MQPSVCQFLKPEVSSLEVRINKEVRDYQESLFFGLTLRQFIFALLAVAVAVGIYFGLRPVLGSEVGWVCVLAAFPFALGGFFQYNSMTFEQFILAVIRSAALSEAARIQIGPPVCQSLGKFNAEGGSQA